MKYSLGCSLDYEIESETVFFFNIQPAEFDGQEILHENLDISGGRKTDSFTMGETGNRMFKVIAPPGKLSIAYRADVELTPQLIAPEAVEEIAPADLPLDVLPHLSPSRFCQSDRLGAFALRQFGDMQPGHERVTAICNWIHDTIDYASGTSNPSTSAVDTIVDHAGVCRDFAHSGIALTRALGIPARYVSAYAWRLDPPDFHAVFEAYLGGRWYLFDATRKAALDGLVRIGIGRDAADGAFSSIFGKAKSTGMSVHIETPERSADQPLTIQAVSLTKI
jgi:transglutaminase-like putative cysteine protease